MKVSSPLSPLAFGQALISTRDLDPVYVMLNGANLSSDYVRRWCLAYWMFYRVDVATEAAQFAGVEYWTGLANLANRVGGPRGAERRHFRGLLARTSIASMRARYPMPENAIDDLSEWSSGGFRGIVEGVRAHWHGFGRWIAFKIADMSETVLGVLSPDALTDDLVLPFWFSEATAGAYAVIGRAPPKRVDPAGPDVRTALAQLVALRLAPAPHWPARGESVRPFGITELETVCCKYKSHLSGYYPVGKDTQDVARHLAALPPSMPGRAVLVAALNRFTSAEAGIT